MATHAIKWRDADTRLMLQATNERDVVARIYRKYRPLVINYLSSLSGRRDQAAFEDMAEETFLRFWRERKQFRGEASIRVYLLGIARNVRADETKHSVREAKALRDKMLERSSTHLEALSEPEAQAYGVELAGVIAKAITHLGHEERQAIWLFCAERMTLKEIAKKCNCSVANVKSRLFRARQQLRGTLSQLDQ